MICDWWISIHFVCFCVSRFVSCDRDYDWRHWKTQLRRQLLSFRVCMFMKGAVIKMIMIITEIAHPLSGSLSTLLVVKLEFGNVGFWVEGKTGVPQEKPRRARERTNNKLNPNMASKPGFEPRPHWWEASALTTAPPSLSK